MEYKGHIIDVSVCPDVHRGTFHAMYAVRRNGGGSLVGTVAGRYATIEAAQLAAEQAAQRWVDQAQGQRLASGTGNYSP